MSTIDKAKILDDNLLNERDTDFKHFKRTLDAIQELICTKVTKVTELQAEISECEQEIFKAHTKRQLFRRAIMPHPNEETLNP